MSVEPDPIFPSYTVAGTGPYAIGWPYASGAVRAVVVLAGVRTELVAGTDFTVAPLSSDTTGNMTLSAGAAATYAGGTLYPSRNTVAQQGWIGVLGDREKGLEAQLDVLTMKAQEVEHVGGGLLRLDAPTLPFVAVPDAVVMFDATGQPKSGPTATAVAGAQQAATDAIAARDVALAAAASALNANGNNTWTGQNTFTNHLHVASDKSLYMGGSDNAEMLYSSAGDKWIARAKAALTWLSLRFSNFEITNFDNTKNFLRGIVNAQVELYFNGLKRLETTTTGATVTGTLVETDRAAETWHTVPRLLGTWYQNTTGRRITVLGVLLAGGTNERVSLHVNTSAADLEVATQTTIPGGQSTVSAAVPPGHYYKIGTNGSGTLQRFMELS